MNFDSTRMIVFLHVVLFAYWLGADLGVMLTSVTASRPGVSADARRRLHQAGVLIDMAPRSCLVLMVPVGFTLAQPYGSPIRGGALALLWIAGLVWLWLVWMVHFKEGARLGRLLWNIDFGVRTLVMLGFVGFGLWCLVNGAPIDSRWLALKILLFGGIILLGLMIRVILLRAHRPVAQPTVEADTSSPSAPFLTPLRMVVFGIWGLVLALAFLGVVKPF